MLTIGRRPFHFADFVSLHKEMAPFLVSPSTIEMDFSRCKFFGPGGMVPLIAMIHHYSERGWVFEITPPKSDFVFEYWEKAGWVDGITRAKSESISTGQTFTPLASYTDHDALNEHLNRAIEVLAHVSDLGKGVITAVEWAVNEIADNVLVHADGAAGWLQVIATPRKSNVKIVVADCGPGIVTTIREGFSSLDNDAEALEKAVEAGATRNPAIGQGNGLAGSIRIAEAAGGWVNIWSGSANLRLFDTGEFKTLPASPFNGTVVAITLPTDKPIDAKSALWGSEPISTVFENSNLTASGLEFVLLSEATAFGNRATGAELATKLRNLIAQYPDDPISINFEGIDMTTASFLDEFLAKLIMSEGVTSFFSRFQLQNMSDFVKSTADAVIAQRLRQV